MRAGTRYYTMFYSRWQLIIMKSTPLSLYHQITFQQHYFRDLVEIPSFTCPKLQTHDIHSVQHELRSMSHNFNRLFNQIPLQKLPSDIVVFKQLHNPMQACFPHIFLFSSSQLQLESILCKNIRLPPRSESNAGSSFNFFSARV